MGAKIDLTGKVFGRLTVLFESDKAGIQICWNCRCSCGNNVIVRGADLRHENTQSCGCFFKDTLLNRLTKHGQSHKTSEYETWKNIRRRCYDFKNQDFHIYGGRGIIVCERWLKSFDNFFKDMGKKPSPIHSIERDDNDGNYEPNNCRWATPLEQRRNSRFIHWIEYEGSKMVLKDWAKILDISRAGLRKKLKKKSFAEIYKEWEAKNK